MMNDSTAPLPPLPPGWTAAKDPASGRVYFANPHTGESSWEPPPLPPPPPPPANLPPPPVHADHQTAHNVQVQSHFVPQNHGQTYQQQQEPIGSEQPPQQQQPVGPAHVAALATNGLLVPAARAVADAKAADGPHDNAHHSFELQALSAGQIADLCHIQQEEFAAQEDGGSTIEPYTPVNPHGLPSTAKRPPMEAGRLDIRVHSLYEKLRKIQQ